MIEYIGKQALLAEYDRVHVGPPDGARKLIEEAPAADVAPVVHGRWIRYHEADLGWDEWGHRCSRCKWEIEDGKNPFPLWDKRCPFCDAKMDLKDGE